MPSERYLFIPFLRTKSQMGQTKNRSSQKSHKDHSTIIATNQLCLEAINKLLDYLGVKKRGKGYKIFTKS